MFAEKNTFCLRGISLLSAAIDLFLSSGYNTAAQAFANEREKQNGVIGVVTFEEMNIIPSLLFTANLKFVLEMIIMRTKYMQAIPCLVQTSF